MPGLFLAPDQPRERQDATPVPLPFVEPRRSEIGAGTGVLLLATLLRS